MFPVEVGGVLMDATGGIPVAEVLLGSESKGEADACADRALCSRTQ